MMKVYKEFLEFAHAIGLSTKPDEEFQLRFRSDRTSNACDAWENGFEEGFAKGYAAALAAVTGAVAAIPQEPAIPEPKD